MHPYKFSTIAILALITCFLVIPPIASADQRPNILLVMADDMGFSLLIMPGPADTFCSYGPLWANASNTPFKQYKGTNYEGGISTPPFAFQIPTTILQPKHPIPCKTARIANP